MHSRRLLAALSAALMLSGASALAQQPGAKPAPGMPMDHGMMGDGMGRGMMGGGMMGMMGRGMIMIPQMPPGNDKLQFQMQAEMMQKIGEIAAKYAQMIREEKPR